MIKRVRCIKEMPFCKVGEMFDVEFAVVDFGTIDGYKIVISANSLIDNGWLEEIKEPESLAEKFQDSMEQQLPFPKNLAQIAYSHFKSNPSEIGCVSKSDVLETFNRTVENIITPIPSVMTGYDIIRKALENMGKI